MKNTWWRSTHSSRTTLTSQDTPHPLLTSPCSNVSWSNSLGYPLILRTSVSPWTYTCVQGFHCHSLNCSLTWADGWRTWPALARERCPRFQRVTKQMTGSSMSSYSCGRRGIVMVFAVFLCLVSKECFVVPFPQLPDVVRLLMSLSLDYLFVFCFSVCTAWLRLHRREVWL